MTQAQIQAKLLELLKSDDKFDAVQGWIEVCIALSTVY